MLWTILLRAVGFYTLLKIFQHRRFLYICVKTLPRDVYAAIIFGYVNAFLLYIKYTNQTTASYFDGQVIKRRGKPCFYFEEEVWTYEQVQKESYKVGNFFQSLGYKKGDTVALMMENRPEYVFTWLGLSRIGVVTSLLNYNIRLKSLEHCVNVSNSTAIIFGSEMTPAIQEVINSGGFKNLELYCIEDRTPAEIPLKGRPVVNLSEQLDSTLSHPTVSAEQLNNDDVILLVYTSGTTGLPKASLVRQSRVFSMSMSATGARLKSGKDILITPVPLYHVQGGVLGVTAAIFHGVPQVILRKFSASRFWSQCIKYKATAGQYLGEIISFSRA
ncbi:Long-chain fatty acid transport protein 4 [Folsomia candida]|uniref:Long-chain-fatty-acid--CoA ligase n=1 Tax=Folsomia candida TaxID=158441 RepID=A0A226DEZ2_FOLCA|nr:Long-chain fatty acid transport protein 4 [Folsomia candida]